MDRTTCSLSGCGWFMAFMLATAISPTSQRYGIDWLDSGQSQPIYRLSDAVSIKEDLMMENAKHEKWICLECWAVSSSKCNG